MRIILKMACLTLLVAATGCPGNRRDGEGRERAVVNGTITGAIKYVDLEGGFYGIVTDAGRKLDPVNLPGAFKVDGLRIRARVVKAEQQASTHMWGPLVRIIGIERL